MLIPGKQAHFHRSFPTLARARLGSGAPVSRYPEPIFPGVHHSRHRERLTAFPTSRYTARPSLSIHLRTV
ncbi:hypothetical protein B0H10DRAFT_2032071 [Mycena sp. CBHHK59/15]|nr:hypothetical protein B0H10DRAFT_2032071 [Mycena sp. CBHHK59/15]